LDARLNLGEAFRCVSCHSATTLASQKPIPPAVRKFPLHRLPRGPCAGRPAGIARLAQRRHARVERHHGRIRCGLCNRARQSAFVFDTRLPGNRNTGHESGARLGAQEKHDLIAFLQSLEASSGAMSNRRDAILPLRMNEHDDHHHEPSRAVLVDESLIDAMLALSVEERLLHNDRMLRTIELVQRGLREARPEGDAK
jgi:hypothetical protein